MTVVYFYAEPLVKQINQYYTDNPNEKGVMNLPDDPNKFTPEQYNYYSNFICKYAEMKYFEDSFFDFYNCIPFNLRYAYTFKCYAMPWSNKSQRVVYLAGIKDRFIGKRLDTRLTPEHNTKYPTLTDGPQCQNPNDLNIF